MNANHEGRAGPTHTAAAWTARRPLAAALIAAGMSAAPGAPVAGDFYLRGGIGFDRSAETVFTDRDCASTAPAALYGCGRGGDGAPLRSRGGFGTAPALEAGLGVVAATYGKTRGSRRIPPESCLRGHANFLAPHRRQAVTADLSSVSAMLVGYVDLPGLGLPRLGPFAPFAGAGVGVVRTRIGETHMMFPRTTTIVPGARRTGFAWMATVGVATALNERTTLDLAWRYTDLARWTRAGAKAGWSGATGAVSRCRSIWPQQGRSSGATGSGCRCATHCEARVATSPAPARRR